MKNRLISELTQKIRKSYFLQGFLFALISFLITFIIVLATPPNSPYRPGETLNPNCSPNDPNCTIYPPLPTFISTTTLVNLDNNLLTFSTGTISFLGINIGIGTTTPQHTLDVVGTAHLRGSSGGIGLFVDILGNIGIGTTMPSVKLDVNGNIRYNSNISTDESESFDYINFSKNGGNLIDFAWLEKPVNILQFKTATNLEYWDGTNWVSWSTNDWKYLLDGRPDTYFTVDSIHKKFRFTVDIGAWTSGGQVVVYQEWSTGPPVSYTLTVESSADLTTWTQRAFSSCSNTYWCRIAIDNPQDHNYLRFTFDTNTNNYSTNWMEVAYYTMRKSYVGHLNRPYYWNWEGNIGIGTMAPVATLHVVGRYRFDTTGESYPLFNTIGNTYMYANAIANSYVELGGYDIELGGINFVLQRAGGNVGIGTTSPAGKLHINAGGYGNIGFGGSNPDFWFDGGEDSVFWFKNTGGLMSGRTSFVYGATELMSILNNGNVGIGTIIPGAKLSVMGDVAVGTTTVDNAQGWARTLTIQGGSNAKLLVTETTAGVKTGIFSHSNWSGTVGRIGTESNHDLRLTAGFGNDVMTLTTAGNIGVGTTIPENTEGWDRVLDVYGISNSKIIATTNAIQTGIWSHNLGFYGAPAGGIVGTKTNHHFSLITNASVRITITSDGNVGIGTTTPTTRFQVVGTSTLRTILPETHNAYDLGSATTKWRYLYAATTSVGDLVFANQFRFVESTSTSGEELLILKNQRGEDIFTIDEKGNLTILGKIIAIFDEILEGLKDKIVQVKELIADRIFVKEIVIDYAEIKRAKIDELSSKTFCLEGDDGERVCINKDQLKELLQRNGTSFYQGGGGVNNPGSASSSDPGSGGDDDSGSVSGGSSGSGDGAEGGGGPVDEGSNSSGSGGGGSPEVEEVNQ